MSCYYRLNLFSVICLNSVFQSMFPKSRKVYINISSILALQPLTTWGNYCGGKAARDAIFRVLAVEKPEALVLNYAPGPLDTPMIAELLADGRTDQVVRTLFEDLKRTGALNRPVDSASKLVALLRRRNFKSGDHIDFYDEKVKEAVGSGGGSPPPPPPPPAAFTPSASASGAPPSLPQGSVVAPPRGTSGSATPTPTPTPSPAPPAMFAPSAAAPGV